MPEKVFPGWTGINNRDRRWELKVPTKDDPRSDLSGAQNVDLDDSGFPSMRLGVDLVLSIQGAHSGFSAYGCSVFVKGAVLYRFNPGTRMATALCRVGVDSKMRYFAGAGRIFFTNQVIIGEVVDGAARVFDDSRVSDDLSPLPAGQAIAFFKGKLLTFEDNVLNESIPGHLSVMEAEGGFKQFPETGRVIAPSVDGLYAGTENGIYFGAGSGLGKMPFVLVGNFGAKDVPVQYVDATAINGMRIEGRFPLITTDDGVCLGLPQGQLYNLTRKRFVMPGGTSGSSVLLNKNGSLLFITSYR